MIYNKSVTDFKLGFVLNAPLVILSSSIPLSKNDDTQAK